MQTTQIALSFDPEMKTEAQKISQSTGLPLYLSSSVDQPSFLLHVTTTHLELIFTEDTSFTPLFIDFLSGKSRHRRLYGGGKGQQLAKAIGLKKYKNPTILDTTAGLGRDAFVLATLGCKVTLIERALPAYLLLKDALSRAQLSNDADIQQILQRMKLIQTDSLSYLSSLQTDNYPDVIYIDPMFPSREKSAKVKKEMTMFHSLIGKDNDGQQIIENALPCALKRIVVKRPRLAEPLLSKPAYQITGKSTRYDIYLPTSRSEASH